MDLCKRGTTLVLQAAGGGTGKELELLKGITGAFRPGVLTALMGAPRSLPLLLRVLLSAIHRILWAHHSC